MKCITIRTPYLLRRGQVDACDLRWVKRRRMKVEGHMHSLSPMGDTVNLLTRLADDNPIVVDDTVFARCTELERNQGVRSLGLSLGDDGADGSFDTHADLPPVA